MASKSAASSRKKSSSSSASSFTPDSSPPLIAEKYHDIVALGSLFFALVLFFSSALIGGKVFLVPDNTAAQAFETILDDAAASGVFPLWIPYIFSGMPAYGSLTITGERSFDLINYVWTLVLHFFMLPFANREAAYVVIHFFLFAAGVYALLRFKGHTPFQSAIGAVGAGFATLSLVWITVGHNTKMIAIAMIPYTFIFLERLRHDVSWREHLLTLGLLSIVLNIQARSVHPQMMFYAYLAIGVYFLFQLSSVFTEPKASRSQAMTRFGRSAGGFVAGLLLAIAFSADTYLSVWEYKDESIRGRESITAAHPELASLTGQSKESTKKASGGIDYDYATSWSFGVSEVITFFAPSYYGFGNDSYWGPQPFTAAPQFFGTLILLLALVGLVRYWEDSFVKGLVVIGSVALLISFGRYMPLLYDPLFYYMPFFGKFRAPSMSLCLLLVSATILAGYGVKAFEEAKGSNHTALAPYRYMAFGSVGLFLIGLIGLSAFKDSYLRGIAESDKGKMLIAQYKNPAVISAFNDQLGIFESMKGDFIISLFLMAALFGLGYAMMVGKVSRRVFQLSLLGLLVIDLSRANSGLLESLKPNEAAKTAFSTPDYVNELKKDSDLFRILPMIRETDANWFAYHRLESVGGYQGAKLRRYQDLIELFGSGNTESPSFFQYPVLLDLLSVKYLILDRAVDVEGFSRQFEGGKVLLRRDNPTPRAWFVESISSAKDVDILKSIAQATFDPKTTAFVSDEEAKLPEGVLSQGTVSVLSRDLSTLTLTTTSEGNGFLFVSEIFYSPGWKCLIDGVEVPIYRTNYTFRGVMVPEGTHRVEFVAVSSAFKTGKVISIAGNVTLFGIMIFSLVGYVRRRTTTSNKPEAAK